MSAKPRVSVIIPVHNRPRELRRAVKSVLAQTYTDYEVIIVDDDSSDDTWTVIQELEQCDPRIRGIRNDRNGGGAYTRNQGVLHSCGELIAFLDSDDEWLQEKLSKQVEHLDRCAEGSVVVSYFEVVGKGRDAGKYGPGCIFTGRLRTEMLKGHCGARTTTILIRREHFDRVGGFSQDLQSMQEFDLWIKLSEYYAVECVPEFLAILHTDADVRISINPKYRIAGIEGFMTKWSATIEKEVGSEYVRRIRAAHLGTVYFGVLLAAFRRGDHMTYLNYESKLNELGYVSWKRRSFIWVAHSIMKLKSIATTISQNGI